jgi:hypothetical protein
VLSESGSTYVTITWSKSENTELPVIGYQVFSDQGKGGELQLIYDGTNYPNVRKIKVTGLPNGLPAAFTVTALNFNGPSE